MQIIVGIDEVGRGCWAGPLVAAAVVLSEPIDGLMDSKKLSAERRKILAKEIYLKADAVGLGWVDAKRVDTIGLTAANSEAMQIALEQIKIPYTKIIIDGNYNYLQGSTLLQGLTLQTLVKADSLVASVSAASIVAKVVRDAFMAEAALQYPEYGFEKHVGYGTKFHHDRIKQYGACKLHRMSYKPLQALLKAADV